MYAAGGGRQNAGEVTVAGTRLNLEALVAGVVDKLGPPRFDIEKHDGRYFERLETFARKHCRAGYVSAAALEDAICRTPFVDLEARSYSDADNEHLTRRVSSSGQIHTMFSLLKTVRSLAGLMDIILENPAMASIAASVDRQFFATDNGLLGVATPGTSSGDLVCLIVSTKVKG
jgi:hypothetical protein